jgi:hypothetical protein
MRLQEHQLGSFRHYRSNEITTLAVEGAADERRHVPHAASVVRKHDEVARRLAS